MGPLFTRGRRKSLVERQREAGMKQYLRDPQKRELVREVLKMVDTREVKTYLKDPEKRKLARVILQRQDTEGSITPVAPRNSRRRSRASSCRSRKSRKNSCASRDTLNLVLDDASRDSLVSLASEWSQCTFEDGARVFSMTERTTSKGEKRSDCRDRYLEIQRFPTAHRPGRGKYFFKGEVWSVFTFSGGENGVFDSKQRNGRSFTLAPIIKDEKPVGFIWTMPEEYPLFEARFGLSEAARKELSEIKTRSRSNSAFGRFQRKRSVDFARQNRFAKKRDHIKLKVGKNVNSLNVQG